MSGKLTDWGVISRLNTKLTEIKNRIAKSNEVVTKIENRILELKQISRPLSQQELAELKRLNKSTLVIVSACQVIEQEMVKLTEFVKKNPGFSEALKAIGEMGKLN